MANNKGQSKLTKEHTRALMTFLVRRHGPISRVQLAEVSGFSTGYVSGVIDDLLSDGTLAELGPTPATRGRPMVLLDINPNGPPVAGVWIGPECAYIAVADFRGDVLARRNYFYSTSGTDAESVIPAIIQGLHRCCDSAGIDPASLLGVGVCVAGLVDPLLGNIDRTHRYGWENVPVGRLLEEHFHVPVYVENDVHTGAIAAQWFGDDSASGDAIYVLVYDYIGAAIVQNHEVLRGVHSRAGLFGHMTIDPSGPECACGQKGCLEAMASDMAFLNLVWPKLNKRPEDLSVQQRRSLVYRAIGMARAGDPGAVKALGTVTKYLGMAIANMIRMFDPQVVFIGGSIIEPAPDIVLDLVQREVLEHVWVDCRGVQIRAHTQFGQRYIYRGMVDLVLWQPFKGLPKADLLSAIPAMPGGVGRSAASQNPLEHEYVLGNPDIPEGDEHMLPDSLRSNDSLQ